MFCTDRKFLKDLLTSEFGEMSPYLLRTSVISICLLLNNELIHLSRFGCQVSCTSGVASYQNSL